MKVSLTEVLRFITSTSALILFFSMFMPAVSGCNNQPVYPYEILSLKIYLPYLWGLSVFIITILLKVKNKNFLKYYFRFHLFLMLIWIIDWGYGVSREVLSSENFAMDIIYPFVIWLLIIIALPIYVIKKRKIPAFDDQIIFRSIWTGALMANSLFILFITDHHFYGLTISFFSSIALILSGVLEEFKEDLSKIFV